MPHISICDSNKAIGLEVRDFIANVTDTKEESITDYLIWRWKLLDARFKFLSAPLCQHNVRHLSLLI